MITTTITDYDTNHNNTNSTNNNNTKHTNNTNNDNTTNNADISTQPWFLYGVIQVTLCNYCYYHSIL